MDAPFRFVPSFVFFRRFQIAFLLYDKNTKVGEISDWTVTVGEAKTKNILGKIVTLPRGKDTCCFTSPKPINRKTTLTVIEDRKKEYQLEIIAVKGSTFVTASIQSIQNVK